MTDAPRPARARTPLGDASNRGAGGLRDWGAAAAKKKAPRAQSTHPIVSRLPPSPAERAAQETSPARRRAPSMPPRAAPNVEVRKLTAYAAYTRMHMLKNKMRNEEAMEQLLRHMSAAEDVELPEVDRAPASPEAPEAPRSPATPEPEEDAEEAEEEEDADDDDVDDDDVVEAPEPASPPFSPEAASRDDLDMSDLELEQSPRRQPARAFGGAGGAPVARPVQTAVRLSAYEATLARPEIMDKFLRLQSDLFAKRAARPDLCAGGDVEDPRPSPGRRGRAGRDLADGDAVGAVRRGLERFAPYLFSRAADAAGRAARAPPRGDVYGSAVDADSSAPEAAVWCPHEANDVDQPSPPKPPRCDYDDACVAEWADAYAPKFLPRA